MNVLYIATKLYKRNGLTNKECAQMIAENFALISNEYEPIKTKDLPTFLPSLRAPQLEEYTVYKRLSQQKKTKSTLPIDIPASLRKEFAPELAGPLTDIFNQCLIIQNCGNMNGLPLSQGISP